MPKKQYYPDEDFVKLREPEVLLSNGINVEEYFRRNEFI
jgi:hypothetical protein